MKKHITLNILAAPRILKCLLYDVGVRVGKLYVNAEVVMIYEPLY